MTWNEAKKAFMDQVPVTYMKIGTTRNPIPCTRIAEIALRYPKGGKPYGVVAGMDLNENCLYYDRPEFFEITGGNNANK